MVYMHAVFDAFCIIVVKMLLKREVRDRALISHGITLLTIENHGKSWNCVFEFLWEPCVVLMGVTVVYSSLLLV